MSKTFQKHLDAVKAGTVTKSNVRGIRIALNNHEREARGYPVSRTGGNCTAEQRDALLDDLLRKHPPKVAGELHDTGIALLQSKRYAKQLSRVADIVADIDHFRLIDFDYIGRYGDKVTPVYRAYDTKGRNFEFVNIPWQSGGNGPTAPGGGPL